MKTGPKRGPSGLVDHGQRWHAQSTLTVDDYYEDRRQLDRLPRRFLRACDGAHEVNGWVFVRCGPFVFGWDSCGGAECYVSGSSRSRRGDKVGQCGPCRRGAGWTAALGTRPTARWRWYFRLER